MNKIIYFLVLCVFSNAHAVLPKPNVVAQINGEDITIEQFNKRYQWYVDRFKFKISKKEFLKNLIDLELSAQEAKRKGIDKDEKMLYDEKVLLSQHLLEQEVYSRFENVKVSDNDLKKYFKESPEIRASHILFKLEPNADPKAVEEARKKALEVLKKAKAGEDFSELSKKYSEGPSAKNGGDLDYFTRDSMTPEFSDVAFKLKKVGDISDLVRTKYGFHIIKLTGLKDFKQADKRRMEHQLRTQKQKEIYDQFFTNLKKKSKVVLHEELVKE